MSWLTRVRNALPFVAKTRDARQSLAQVQGLRADGVHQGIGGKSLRLPELRPSRPHRPEAALRTAVRRRQLQRCCPRPRCAEDPLKFRDTEALYRPHQGRAHRDRRAAMRCINARGTIDGRKAVVGVQDFAFMGGSMGLAVGEAFVARRRGGDRAIARPYIIFTAAGGARMQEGILSLMQMPRATVAIQMLHDAGLPYIVVLTDPTTGGVTASYAMLGDVQIAEPGALIGFAGQRVIEQHDPREAARGLPARRISARSRHARHGRRTARSCARRWPADRLSVRREGGGVTAPPPLRERSGWAAIRPAVDGPPRPSRQGEGNRWPTHATSADPAVQAQLDRLWRAVARRRHPRARAHHRAARAGSATRICALPPVFHVAGTNGKGSTCAFLRAAIEAAGLQRPCLYQPASRPLQRAHPPRRAADRRRRARRAARRGARSRPTTSARASSR